MDSYCILVNRVSATSFYMGRGCLAEMFFKIPEKITKKKTYPGILPSHSVSETKKATKNVYSLMHADIEKSANLYPEDVPRLI